MRNHDKSSQMNYSIINRLSSKILSIFNLINFIDQVYMLGGGTWGYYSLDNDATMDLLIKYHIHEFVDNKIVKHTKLKSTNAALKEVFKDYERRIGKKSKNPTDYSAFNLNYDYLGVVIYMLFDSYAISKQYLVRALIHAYKCYIKVCILGYATGWKDPDERLKALRQEILMLNYGINTGTPLKIPSKYLPKLGTDKIDKFIKEHNTKDFQDKIFLKHLKNGKNKYYPILDKNLLNDGMVMAGYEKYTSGRIRIEYYIIIQSKDGRKSWKIFDPFDQVACNYFQLDYLYDIYGNYITKVNKTDLRKDKK